MPVATHVAGELPAETLQKWERTRDDAGEAVSLLTRVELAAGQRLVTFNITFCPPFAVAPEVSAEVVDGPAATVDVEQAETYGARLELRAESAAETDQQAVVQIYAYAEK